MAFGSQQPWSQGFNTHTRVKCPTELPFTRTLFLSLIENKYSSGWKKTYAFSNTFFSLSRFLVTPTGNLKYKKLLTPRPWKFTHSEETVILIKYYRIIAGFKNGRFLRHLFLHKIFLWFVEIQTKFSFKKGTIFCSLTVFETIL